ncbi:hypothetical protein A0U42_05400 [Megasphaera sp. DISK 18]|nr:hypothetical protein A0U42_05400 [Megasphaera sp. DISK 18]
MGSAPHKSGCNVFQGCRPRHDGNVAAVAKFNHNYIEAGEAKTESEAARSLHSSLGDKGSFR